MHSVNCLSNARDAVIADLKTMSKRVESEQYYVTLEMFIADAKRMFANARTYNSPETIYFKCATRHVSLILLLSLSFLFGLASEGKTTICKKFLQTHVSYSAFRFIRIIIFLGRMFDELVFCRE